MVQRFASGPRPLLDERTLRTAVGALGVLHVVVGLYMFFLPGSFYFRIGTYGPENTHYVGDVATFVLAIGIGLLLAVGRPAWRTPVLAVAALWYGLHALNHLFDIDEARSTARGVIDFLVLAIASGVVAWLAAASDRARQLTGNDPATADEELQEPAGARRGAFEDHSDF